jgi:hypothetical protein
MRIADGVAVGAPKAVPLPWAVQIFAGNIITLLCMAGMAISAHTQAASLKIRPNAPQRYIVKNTVPLEIGLVCLQMINREGRSLRNCRPSVNTITNGLCRAILTFFGVILDILVL